MNGAGDARAKDQDPVAGERHTPTGETPGTASDQHGWELVVPRPLPHPGSSSRKGHKAAIDPELTGD